MQASPYNNPLFAQGLAQLVQGFIGNPGKTAQSELYASQALLNNQTAQYRDAIGNTGLSGDLASMMIRSLQAGPDYSRYAPSIGSAVTQINDGTFGRKSGVGPASGTPLTAGARSIVLRELKARGIEGDGAMVALDSINKLALKGMGQTEAITYGLQNIQRSQVPDPNDPAGTMLSRIFGMANVSGNSPAGTIDGPITGVTQPPSNAPVDAAKALNDARIAIKMFPNRKQEIVGRLVQAGIDPGNL